MGHLLTVSTLSNFISLPHIDHILIYLAQFVYILRGNLGTVLNMFGL